MSSPRPVAPPGEPDMPSTALEPEAIPRSPLEPGASLPGARDLVDQVPQQFKASRATASFTFVLGLVYLTFCLKPIWHTDLWGHILYGQTIWQTGGIPAEEPLMPLAKGMPFIDTAWLSQLLTFGVLRGLGLAGLQTLTAVAVTLICSGTLIRSYATTKSGLFATLGVALLLWFDWNQFIVIRPQLFALACFTLLFTRLTGGPRRSDWATIPGLFLVWTNLHGSFPIGIALIATFTLGRGVDLLRRAKRVDVLWHDARLRRLVLLTELSFAATLINPYGHYLYGVVWTFGSNPNLASLTEWQPLQIRSWLGGTWLALFAALAIFYRLTPRRIAAWEPLTLIGLAAASLWSSRMSAWLAPVASYLLVIHAHAAWRAWRHAPLIPAPSPRAGLWTVATLGLIWIFFGYSPLGLKLIHGREPILERAVSEYTPLGAAEYLRDFPPVGQVFNIYEWGDYLQWAGPPGIRVFVNSHAHVVPEEIWKHYLRVINVEPGWQEVLDRYGVNTVVADRAVREELIHELKGDSGWSVGFEDHISTVFVRKKTI